MLGAIVLAGTLVHALTAGALFSISWFDWPVLRGLHSGDGFWNLAPDARGYYRLAAAAATNGLGTISDGSASPVYVATVALFMDGIGIHPAVPLLLNLLFYIAACALVVAVARTRSSPTPDRAAAWPLLGLSFSVVLLFCGTQVLKDTMFAGLIVLMAVGARGLLQRMDDNGVRSASLPAFMVALGVFAWAVALIAGIRAYFPVLIGAALGAALGVGFVRKMRQSRWRYASAAAVILVVTWMAFRAGAGVYYVNYENQVVAAINSATGGVLARVLPRSSPELPVATPDDEGGGALAVLDSFREGFVRAGGGTNLGAAADMDDVQLEFKGEMSQSENIGVDGSVAGAPSRPTRLRARVLATAIGLASIFVPVSLLKILGVIDISGGRGLLIFTDLDTIFLDFTLVGLGWLLWRERRALGTHRLYFWFCLVLAAASTVLMAYVVTNLGALVRLRLLIFVPLWMAALALVDRRESLS